MTNKEERYSDAERRRHPRYHTSFRARITTEAGTTDGTVTSLSLSGLQLHCGRQVAEEVLPNVQRAILSSPVNVDVSFEVPTSASSRSAIQVQCRITNARRESRDKFWLGGAFVTFSKDSEEYLQDYLRHFGQRL